LFVGWFVCLFGLISLGKKNVTGKEMKAMFRWLFALSIIWIRTVTSLSIPKPQYEALASFYNSTRGISWTWRNDTVYGPKWNFTEIESVPVSDPCLPHWQGLRCNCTVDNKCEVTGIALSRYNLDGTLPDSMKEFTSLTYLNLSGNNGIGGYFPYARIFSLAMEIIDLSQTFIGGYLPDYLWSLSNLKVFRVWNTILDGPISPRIQNLTELVELNMGLCRFLGTIPHEICDLRKLRVLHLESNFLSGSLYPEIANIRNLTELHWQGNRVTGTIPSSLANLTKLEYFNIAHNDFRGTIPEFGTPSVLRTVVLTGNRFIGTIPAYLLTLEGMQVMDMAVNHLNNSLTTFSVSSSLIKLILDDNYFSGSIPECYFTLMPKLQLISLQNNFFNGTIPASINQLTSMKFIYFGNNYMVGTIPSTLYEMSSLRIASLLYNFYNGTVSNGVSKLTALRVFNIGYNEMTGTIPSSFGKIQNLTRLYLCGNMFHGPIPPEIGNLTYLRYLLLNQNSLTGTIPDSFEKLKYLGWFYLSDNHLHGRPYELLGKLPKLIDMVMFGNQFSGPLPYNSEWRGLLSYSFGFNYFTGPLRLTSRQVQLLVYVDLSKNFLSTTIPAWTMTAPVLAYFYMNENIVQGTIPSQSITGQNLIEFWMDANFLTGPLPKDLGNSTLMQLLRLGDNFLTGTIPQSFTSFRFMETLFLQSNRFTGNLENACDPELQKRIKYIDVSDNFFTGTVPSKIFNSTSLVSFAASTNCFSGPLSSGICDAINLEDFVLDGASTAIRCQRLIFPSKTFFQSSSVSNGQSSSTTHLSKAFILSKRLANGIPSCLFNMSKLQLLHLSGNALTGTIPNDIAISPALLNLSIANNQLSGPIPITIQKKRFFNIDLSYNKFSGTLSEEIPTVEPNGSFRAQRNRLSGYIPSNLRTALNISILQGNLFNCDIKRSDLPSHDPKSESFTCGSDQTNRSFIIWLCIWPFVLVILILLDRFFLHVIFADTNQSANETNDVPQDQDKSWAASWKRLNRFLILIHRWRNSLYVPLQVLIEEDEDNMKHFLSKRETDLSLESNAEFKQEQDSISSVSQSVTGSGSRSSGKPKKMGQTRSSLLQSDTDRGRSSGFSSNSEDAANLRHGPLLASVLPPHMLSASSSMYRYSSRPSQVFSPSVSQTAGANPRDSLFLNRISNRMWPSFSNNRNTGGGMPLSFSAPNSASIHGLRPPPTTTVLTSQQAVSPSFSGNPSTITGPSSESSLSVSITPSMMSASTTSQPLDPPASSLISERVYILSSFRMMKIMYLGLAIFALLVLLPLYIYFSLGFSTYTFSYIWRVSPMLLSGMEPGYFLFAVFVVILSAVWLRVDYHKTVILRSMYEYQVSWPQLSYYFLFAIINLVALLSVNILYVLTIQNYGSIVLFLSEMGLAVFKVAWNELVVIRGFTFLKKHYFIYILGTGAESIDSLSESESKSLLGKHSKVSSRAGSRNTSNRTLSTIRERLISTTHRTYRDPQYGRFYDLIVQLTLIITNLLLMPALATAVANANCFYNIIQPPATVAGGFQLASCENVIEVGRIVVCLGRTAVFDSITYTAPFLYTYQCSSFLIINYASVYVYFILLVTVIVPVCKALIRLWDYEQRKHQQKIKKERRKEAQSSANASELDEEVGDNDNHMTNPLHDRGDMKKQEAADKEPTVRRSTFVIRPTLWQFLPFKHHGNDENDGNNEEYNNDSTDSDAENFKDDATADDGSNDSTFNKRQLIIRFQSYLALMLIFGVLFPPMAIIICLGAMMMMFFEESTFGHVIYDQHHVHYQRKKHSSADSDKRIRQQWSASHSYRLYMLRQNADTLRYLTNPVMLWFLLTIVSSIYGYLLFDTMGDSLVADRNSSTDSHTTVSHSQNWRIVLTLTIVTVLWPTMLLIWSILRTYWRARAMHPTGYRRSQSWWQWCGGLCWNAGDLLQQMRKERRALRETTRRIWEVEERKRRAHQMQQDEAKQQRMATPTRKKKIMVGRLKNKALSDKRQSVTTDSIREERDGEDIDDMMELGRESRGLRISEMVTIRGSEDISATSSSTKRSGP
jgi:Leucine-rich repeat (LRR) protein